MTVTMTVTWPRRGIRNRARILSPEFGFSPRNGSTFRGRFVFMTSYDIFTSILNCNCIPLVKHQTFSLSRQKHDESQMIQWRFDSRKVHYKTVIFQCCQNRDMWIRSFSFLVTVTRPGVEMSLKGALSIQCWTCFCNDCCSIRLRCELLFSVNAFTSILSLFYWHYIDLCKSLLWILINN